MAVLISPAEAFVFGDGVQSFVDGDAVNWTTTVGSLYVDVACTIPYVPGSAVSPVYLKPFNRTVDGTISSGNGDPATVHVMGVLPNYPHYPMEWEGGLNASIISIARSGRVRGRVLGDASYLRDYKLVYNNKKVLDVAAFELFHQFHYPDKVFLYRNLWHNIEAFFRFDSKLKGTAVGSQRGNLDVAIAEVPYSFGSELDTGL
jgi:hypothetical protein